MTWEMWLLTLGSSVAMIGAAFYYYKKGVEAQAEYEKARETIEDVIISFNRELQGHEERLSLVSYKAEAAFSGVEELSGTLKTHGKQLEESQKSLKNIEKLKETVTSRLDEVSAKVEELGRKQGVLEEELAKIRKTVEQKPSVGPEIETVIPIRRETALAPLNKTELEVLKILAEEGEMSAPEIKTRINLSREHTARLMRKLYEAGYLERKTQRLPYIYKIKDEMLELLKKQSD